MAIRSGKLTVCALLCALTTWAQQYSITTVAGGTLPSRFVYAATSIGAPQSMITDSAGNAYFTSLNAVFELAVNGALTPVAGNSRAGYSGDGGLAINAQLSAPSGLAMDSTGDIFIADSGNNRIREVSANGVMTTVAGIGTAGFSGDGGPAVSAQLSGAQGVAVDGSGNLFIADSGNNRVRKVSTAGIITTIAGNGNAVDSGDGVPAVNAQLSATSIAVDGQGDVFIADSANYRVREISASGTLTTVAGAGTPGYSGDGGFANSAQFSTIHEIAVDQNGSLYIADTGNSCIRKVVSGSRTVSTIAGIGQNAFFGDFGLATSAALAFPFGVALDTSGNVFIADTSNYRIREVNSNGDISTIAGNGALSLSGNGGSAAAAQFYNPKGLAVDKLGDIFVADTANNLVREVLPDGTVTIAAGNGVPAASGDGGTATAASLSGDQGVAVDAAGDLFIADTANYLIREVAAGVIGTVAGSGNSGFAGDGGPAVGSPLSAASVAVDSSGNLFVGDPVNHRVREILANGNIATVAGNGTPGYSGDNGLAVNAQLSAVGGMAVDSAGDIFFADTGNNRVREVSASGTITTVAGNGAAGYSGDGGPATSAQLNGPFGVAVDSSGNLFIADTNNNRVRMVSAGGVIGTVAGNGTAGFTGDSGIAAAGELSHPYGLAIGKSGLIYVADTGNNAIRLLTPVSQPIVITAVVDAASESVAPISPGKFVVIYGTGMGPSQLAVNAPSNGYFGEQLDGTTVSFRGVLAPLYYTSSGQVSAIVPYELAGSTSVQVEVGYNGQVSLPFTVALAPASPGIFTSNATGAGQAAAVNVTDGTINSAANPVKIGDYISLYATGEGQTKPGGVDGKLATVPLPSPNLTVTATVGGVAAAVQYAGGAYGEVAGLMQVNVLIPTGVTPGGYVPVVLTVGGVSTVSGAVWIAVSN